MKPNRIIWLAVLAIVLQACDAGTGKGQSHFENDGVVFDYPSGLTAYKANDAAFAYYPRIALGDELVAALGDADFYKNKIYYRSIRIMRMTMPPGADLETVIADAYQKGREKFPPGQSVLTLDPQIEVDGITGIQKTYRAFSGELAYDLRDIWVQKGENIYILCIWTRYSKPEEFAAFQSSADALIESLRFK